MDPNPDDVNGKYFFLQPWFRDALWGVLSLIALVISIWFGFWGGELKRKGQTPVAMEKPILAPCGDVPVEEFSLGVPSDPLRGEGVVKLLDSETRNLLNTYQEYQFFDANNPARRMALKKLRDSADLRKHYLVEASYRNPESAIFSVLLTEYRRELGNLLPNCIEEEVTTEGLLEVLHVDFEGETSESRYTLILDDGISLTLHPSLSLHTPLESGMRVRVKGIKINKEVLFDGAKTLAQETDFRGGIDILSEPGNPPVKGEQRTVVILANFKNTPQPSLTKDTVKDMVFGEVNRYYKEVSYGLISLSGDVVGWYKLPGIVQSCNAVRTWGEAMKAADKDVDFRLYPRVIVVAPLGPSCGWGGFATTGKTGVRTEDGLVSVSISAIRMEFVNLTAIGHELGHNFGNHHAGFYDCGSFSVASDGCTQLEYGDLYDIMGSKNTGHQNALHKEFVGWLTYPQIQTVTRSGTYTLEPLETAGSGLKAVKIQRAIDDYLFVEYRQPIGFDATLGRKRSEIFNGALLHTKQPNAAGNRSSLLDPTPPGDAKTPALLPGMIFRDPASGAVVTAISAQPQSLSLRVTVGKTNFTPPRVIITYPTGEPTVSGMINVSASVQHNVDIARVDFYYIQRGKPVLFGSDREPPYVVELNTDDLPKGLNYVQAKAYDVTGNEGVSNIAGFFVPLRIYTSSEEEPSFISPIYELLRPGFEVKRPSEIKLPPDLSVTGPEGKEKKDDFSTAPPLSFTRPQSVSQERAVEPIISQPDDFREPRPVLPEVPEEIVAGVLPSGTENAQYDVVLPISGGIPPYTFNLTYGSLSEGLTLDPVTGRISGVPKNAGNFSFRVTVVDRRSSVEKRFTIKIKPAPLNIVTSSLPTGTVEKEYRANLSASWSSPPYEWRITSGSLPKDLVFDSSSGDISGIPKQDGTSNIEVEVKNRLGMTDRKSFSLVIYSTSTPVSLRRPPVIISPPPPISEPSLSQTSGVAPLIINSLNLPAATSGIPYQATFSASGGVSPYSWSIFSGTLPQGLSLDSLSGVISGITTATNTAYSSFSVKATDSRGSWAYSWFSINVKVPPSITVLSPNGGEKLLLNTSYTIRWKAAEFWSKIVIQVKNASTDEIIFETKDAYSSNGSFSWTPIGGMPIPSAKVIISAPDFNISDESDSTFSVEIPPNVLTIRGRFVDRFTKNPLSSVEIRGSDLGGSYTTLARTSANGEFVLITSKDMSSSNYRYFSYRYSCYGSSSLTLQKESSGNLVVAYTIFDPVNSTTKKIPVSGDTVDLGDVWFGPTANLNFSSDIAVDITLEYLGGRSSFGYSVLKTSHSLSDVPLGFDIRVGLKDASGSIFYSPYATFLSTHDCNVPLTLQFNGGGFTWGPTSSIQPPSITIDTLPLGSVGVGVPYSFTLSAKSGVTPYVWSVVSGALPDGILLDSSRGLISGNPLSVGVSNFVIQVRDRTGLTSEKSLRIEIKAPSASTLSAPESLEARWQTSYQENRIMRSIVFKYPSASLSNTRSFRLYEKKPGDSSFRFVTEFFNVASASCSEWLTGGVWVLRREWGSAGGTSTCGLNESWIISEKNPLGNYPAFSPPSNYTVGEYNYYLVAVDNNGDVSPNSVTSRQIFLEPLTILSPTEAQSPIVGTTTFSWTVSNGWPAGARPYNVNVSGGGRSWITGGIALGGSYIYGGAPLDPSQKYSVNIHGIYTASDKTSYISTAIATTTFWISGPTGFRILDLRSYAELLLPLKDSLRGFLNFLGF